MKSRFVLVIALAPLLLLGVLAPSHQLFEPRTSRPVSNSSPGLLRVGVFIGVDGVTFSADGNKFGMFANYQDRETLVEVSSSELNEMAAQLKSAGLFGEGEHNAPQDISIPQSFSIHFASSEGYRQFEWTSQWECSVPERYLKIIESMNTIRHSKVLHDFVAYNRRVGAAHKAHMARWLRE